MLMGVGWRGWSVVGLLPLVCSGGLSGWCANMVRMGQPRDTAWAVRRIARNGRPLRLAHVTLAQGLDERAWEGWSREERAEVLEPFMREGERIHWSNDGEAFIVDEAIGGMAQGAASGTDLETLQEHRRIAQMFDTRVRNEVASARREAMSQAWAEATAEFAPHYVELFRKLLDSGLDENATTADRKLAYQMVSKELDRAMGKPVAAVEDVGASSAARGSARDLMRTAAMKSLPASSQWTPESIAEDERKALEAGVIEVNDETEVE